MRIKAQYDEIKFPAYALSYVINGDDSGIEPEDKQAVDEYLKQYEDEGPYDVSLTEPDEEPYFTWNPEFGLACDVVDVTITIWERED